MKPEHRQKLADEIINLTRDMRTAQRNYFSTKNHEALIKSKNIERALDVALANYGT